MNRFSRTLRRSSAANLADRYLAMSVSLYERGCVRAGEISERAAVRWIKEADNPSLIRAIVLNPDRVIGPMVLDKFHWTDENEMT